ncbi:uncharacterized protein LOC128653259 [Bombina bombina]|uniref:uncharacterized protein LOC128653259 n=1 Tax=Bombina bombina TaxID=8345 RepID=UPI00235A6E39|nr:uncharacterized protein LOC128653259 [Bombina bombina]
MENISKLKMKNIFKNPQNKQTLQTKNENSENDKLLPKKRQKAEKKVNDLKNKLVSFTDCIQKTKKSKKQLSSVEQIFTNLLRNKRYWDACDYIFKQQQHDNHAYSGYKMVADDMWNTVKMALTGDNSQTEHLNSVAACVKWAKEKNLTYEGEFSPNSWAKDLENLFIQYINENIPTVKYDTEIKINLENHLEELKSKSLQQVNMTRSLLGDLYPLYLKCFTHYMHDHLSILASNQFNFEEYVLLYRWANKEWNRQLAYQHETEDFDHLLFKKWFENTGEKIIHTGKQTIIKVLTEILQREMDWNSYLKTELSYYFNDISKELDKVTNAVKDLGDTLRSGIKSLCWDEFDNFIKRTEFQNTPESNNSTRTVHWKLPEMDING